MEPKRVYFSADENFVNFFLGKTGTAILTQLESADEILFFANDEKGKGVKEAGKKLSAWNPSASFRIVTPKSAGNLYVRSGRFTDHFKGLWQRRLDIFILLWSFLFLAAALLTREENLLRISLLAVGITLQTLPFCPDRRAPFDGHGSCTARVRRGKSISGSTRFSLCRLRSSEGSSFPSATAR